MKYSTPVERVIANSRLSAESGWNGTACWDWLGKRKQNRSGMFYGVITRRRTRGPRKGTVQTMLAHRFVVQFVKGRRLSRGQVVMHRCNNSLCVNPDHLVGGTQRTNVRQTVRDGRHSNGR